MLVAYFGTATLIDDWVEYEWIYGRLPYEFAVLVNRCYAPVWWCKNNCECFARFCEWKSELFGPDFEDLPK